jgi:hypothetical protein
MSILYGHVPLFFKYLLEFIHFSSIILVFNCKYAMILLTYCVVL